ncbi:MAG: HAMP domain-containing sensor histidine kinase [Myxococcota bacterium]
MRRRIIAYGVSVLVILMVISIATFWVIGHTASQRPSPMSASFLHELVSADAPGRQRMLTEALEAGTEVSWYAPDGSLLASNVDPPIPRWPTLPPHPNLPPPPDSPRSFDRLPPLEGPRRTRPDLPMMSRPGRTMPERFMIAGTEVLVRPSEYKAPVTPFAIALLVSLVVLVLLSFPVTAAMTRRLEVLAEAARRFGKGDLNQRADASGSDEVSRTAAAFNTMATQIADLRLRERELVANVSHELRTPMARMAVALELTENNPAEATRYLGELARDLRELESLLETIIETFRLDLASPRAREPWPMQRVDLDLRELVEELANDFRARAPGHAFTVAITATPVVRSVDRTLVRRAVMNLLDNARKYSPPGSEIHLALETSGDVVVSDRGQGIDQTDLPYVFEPFFRADRSRTRATGGVGLGLTFVKLVATLHQGAVSVESEPNAGSTFRLSLRTHSDTFGQS